MCVYNYVHFYHNLSLSCYTFLWLCVGKMYRKTIYYVLFLLHKGLTQISRISRTDHQKCNNCQGDSFDYFPILVVFCKFSAFLSQNHLVQILAVDSIPHLLVSRKIDVETSTHKNVHNFQLFSSNFEINVLKEINRKINNNGVVSKPLSSIKF